MFAEQAPGQKKSKLLIIIIAVVVLLLAIGAAVFFLWALVTMPLNRNLSLLPL